MRVHLYAADEAGSAFYRLQEPARCSGQECELMDRVMVKVGVDGDTETRWFARLDVDVIVLSRPAKYSFIEYIEQWQRVGKAVVVDLDDDFTCLHPNHPVRRLYEGRLSRDSGSNAGNMQRACGKADLVTCTSQALADRYAAHGRYVILPNCVPASMLEMQRLSNGHTIGWAGYAGNHLGDLAVTHGGVQAAMDGTGWEFLKVGRREDVQQQLGLARLPRETGPQDVQGYQVWLGALDIGIVPLADSAFNHAKSYLKGIEYAARGVPFVASPTDEYRLLAEDGVGLLAPDRGRSWKREIRRLMEPSTREEVADAGRATVADHHTYETEGYRWAQAWQQAIDHRRSLYRRSARASTSAAATTPLLAGSTRT